MARQLEEINSSGELSSIKKGGAESDKEVVILSQISNIDNTSDADKPVSTAQQAALDLKLNIADISKDATNKSMETLTGFDREDSDVGGKSLGIIQYCHSVASGEVHVIGSDEQGTYTKLTGQTSFADGSPLADRTLAHYHDVGETEFSYWNKGTKVTVQGTRKIQVATDFKGYIGYDDFGDLDNTVTDIRTLLVRMPLVAYLYLNETTGELVWFADERHGIVMDGQTHLQQHNSTGFFIAGGLDVLGLADDGTTFTSIEAGGAGDEDIKMFYSQMTTAPKIFKEGAAGEWRITDDDNKLAIFRTAKACYNLDTAGTWSLAEIDLDYVIMMFVATNNKLAPVVLLVGQTLHADRDTARKRAPAEYFRINAAGLPAHEFHPLATVIIHNEANGQIEVGSDGEIYTSCKGNFPVPMFE